MRFLETGEAPAQGNLAMPGACELPAARRPPRRPRRSREAAKPKKKAKQSHASRSREEESGGPQEVGQSKQKTRR